MSILMMTTSLCSMVVSLWSWCSSPFWEQRSRWSTRRTTPRSSLMVRRRLNDTGLERHSHLPLSSPFPSSPPPSSPLLSSPPIPLPSLPTECRASLIGVGILTKDERGLLTLEKEATSISRFLNRILGLSVKLQNQLFAYFSDTLGQIIQQAQRMGRWDGGIQGQFPGFRVVRFQDG